MHLGDDQIVLDFLTDGSTTELDIRPSAGDSITPDYNNLASSTSLAQTWAASTSTRAARRPGSSGSIR